MERKRTGFALYRVERGWGYAVELYRRGRRGPVLVERYCAGDCPHDSTTFHWNGPGAVNARTLARYARLTAGDMLREHGLTGKVESDPDVGTGDEDRQAGGPRPRTKGRIRP